MFRQNWAYDPTKQNKAETLANMVEVLETLQEFVDAGKIRHIGLSNESAWGTAQYLRIAEERGLPRMQTIQNEYSLLCRLYDTDLAELSHNEEVGLLAFSPLAVGLLTGKYQNGQIPAGSRRSLNDTLGGRVTDRVWPAVDAYLAIAKKHGLDPSQMALAWCNSRSFVTSSIFGATSIAQLETALGAADMVLDQVVLDDIAKAHKAHPMPY
jgi:aryl-alcohol dehydrogenase-like predicted oxidoreductase